MRDIGRELQRRRLERFQPSGPPWGRRGRWIVALAAIWLLYSTILSDHGFYRIWRLQEQNRRADAELVSLDHEIDQLEAMLRSPEQKRRRVEAEIRGRRMAGANELIYDVKPDSQR
jgi:cell division protein FtsB